MRRLAITLVGIAVLGLAPAGAADAADAKAKRAKPPRITRVAPMTAAIGDVLTIQGRHFRTGVGRNRVGFKAPGRPVIYLRAGRATDRTLKVTLSERLATVVGAAPRTFRLRVRTTRFGRAFTDQGLSPTIGPFGSGTDAAGAPAAAAPPVVTTPAGATPGADVPVARCDTTAGDQDADRLPDGFERRIGTDPCTADTDGDGIEDGYEYRSAVDFNDDAYQDPDTALPYPGKVPYPNPLDGSDADFDFDGDLLTLRDEHRLWQYTTPRAQRSFADVPGRPTPLSYSDGLQVSSPARDDSSAAFYAWAQGAGYDFVALERLGPYALRTGTTRLYDIRDVDLSGGVSAREADPLDVDRDGVLADGERDADADGLTNYDELHGAMTPAWWEACYVPGGEAPYGLPFTAPSPTDPDTDGDGVRDGADDTDRDEHPDVMELSRIRASGFDDRGGAGCDSRLRRIPPGTLAPHDDAFGWVQPFNPCMPSTESARCSDAYAASQPESWTALQ